jgi:CrcB protein
VRIYPLIGLGGALGALARLGIDQVFAFTPWATIVVNIIGCIVIGAAIPWCAQRAGWLHPFVVTGVLGGFTTVSAFAADTVGLLLEQQRLVALGYVGVSLVAGLLAVPLGQRLVRSSW